MAAGFSCKEQIAQETKRHALHLAEVLQMGLRQGENEAVPLMYPESEFVRTRQAAQSSSMARAGFVALGTIAFAVAGFVWGRSRRR